MMKAQLLILVLLHLQCTCAASSSSTRYDDTNIYLDGDGYTDSAPDRVAKLATRYSVRHGAERRRLNKKKPKRTDEDVAVNEFIEMYKNVAKEIDEEDDSSEQGDEELKRHNKRNKRHKDESHWASKSSKAPKQAKPSVSPTTSQSPSRRRSKSAKSPKSSKKWKQTWERTSLNPTISLEPTTSPVATPEPSKQPTSEPSRKPTKQPSSSTDPPTMSPTTSPSKQPTSSPNKAQTDTPTSSPSNSPTSSPNKAQTDVPTSSPSSTPTKAPSNAPTSNPSKSPSLDASGKPSLQPSDQLSLQPSSSSSKLPTMQPSNQPSLQPSSNPSKLATPSTTGPTSLEPLCPVTHSLIPQSLILRSSYGNIFSITTPDGNNTETPEGGVETIAITTLSLRTADIKPDGGSFEVWLYTRSENDQDVNENDRDNDPNNDNIVIPSKGDYQASRAKFEDWEMIGEGQVEDLIPDTEFFDNNGHIFNIGTGTTVGPLGPLDQFDNMEDVTIAAREWNEGEMSSDGRMDVITAEGEVTETYLYKIPEENFTTLKLPKYNGKLTLFVTLTRVGLQYGYAAKQEFDDVDVSKYDYTDQTPSLDELNGNVNLRMHVGEGVIFYPWMEEEYFYQTRRFLGKVWYEGLIPCEYA